MGYATLGQIHSELLDWKQYSAVWVKLCVNPQERNLIVITNMVSSVLFLTKLFFGRVIMESHNRVV